MNSMSIGSLGQASGGKGGIGDCVDIGAAVSCQRKDRLGVGRRVTHGLGRELLKALLDQQHDEGLVADGQAGRLIVGEP